MVRMNSLDCCNKNCCIFVQILLGLGSDKPLSNIKSHAKKNRDETSSLSNP